VCSHQWLAGLLLLLLAGCGGHGGRLNGRRLLRCAVEIAVDAACPAGPAYLSVPGIYGQREQRDGRAPVGGRRRSSAMLGQGQGRVRELIRRHDYAHTPAQCSRAGNSSN